MKGAAGAGWGRGGEGREESDAAFSYAAGARAQPAGARQSVLTRAAAAGLAGAWRLLCVCAHVVCPLVLIIVVTRVSNAGCAGRDQIRPDGYDGGGAEVGGWSFAELSQLRNDLDLVRQDVEQRLSLLNQEAPKVNQYQAAVTAAASRPTGKGRGGGGGGQRKKRKTEEPGYADADAASSPRAASAAAGTSDRSVGSGRGRGRGRGGGRKRKKKRETGEEDANEEEEEEETPAPEDEMETMDSTAFWAMIDQQYCDPSEQDIQMLRTIRTTGRGFMHSRLRPGRAGFRLTNSGLVLTGCTAAAPDTANPVPELGLHYMQQWRQEAEAQMVAEQGTAGSRAHGTRGERRGAAEIEWVEAQGGAAAAAALAGAPPTLSELLLSALVEEVPTGQDKPLPLNRSLLQPITGETPLSKPPQDMVKGVKKPKNLDQHLKAALMEVGIIDRTWTGRPVHELQNDEICADLRAMTRQLVGIMKRNEATVARLLDEAKKAGVTRKTESELSGAQAKEIEDRYQKRKRAQKQRKKSKKKKVQGGAYDLTNALIEKDCYQATPHALRLPLPPDVCSADSECLIR